MKTIEIRGAVPDQVFYVCLFVFYFVIDTFHFTWKSSTHFEDLYSENNCKLSVQGGMAVTQ